MEDRYGTAVVVVVVGKYSRSDKPLGLLGILVLVEEKKIKNLFQVVTWLYHTLPKKPYDQCGYGRGVEWLGSQSLCFIFALK